MELLELRKFFQVHDLLKLKHKLSDYFEGLNSAQKKEFIEAVEFSFLPYYRSEISNTKARFKNSGFIQELTNDGIEKVNFIEKWILENKSSNTITQPQQETKTDAPPPKEYNTSQFNDFTYKLFNHIIEEYTTSKGKVKFINIWYFLKRDIINKQNIMFNFTQDAYKIFVKQKHTIEIKKFEKAAFKYEDTEKGILQNITTIYLKNLHTIENT
jgi:hypothetical protein